MPRAVQLSGSSSSSTRCGRGDAKPAVRPGPLRRASPAYAGGPSAALANGRAEGHRLSPEHELEGRGAGPPAPGAITRLSSRYADAFPLRSVIQAIPILGGSLDTMLAGLGARWQYDRLVDFVSAVDTRLRGVECYESVPEIEPSEPLYDFVMKVFDHVVRSRSARKREAFAAIVATQVIEQKPWDEAEAATRLLADLSDLDVTVLTTAASAPICEAPFNGLRVVTLSAKALGGGVTVLRSVVSGAPEHLLRLACSELVARGLLHDEGSGRLSVGAMEYFVVTELGHWFLAWLSDSSRPGESLG